MIDISNLGDNCVSLRFSAEADLDAVMALERDPDNAYFIRQWSVEQHRAALEDGDAVHLIVQNRSTDRVIGYVILLGLENVDKNVEFKRIVIRHKGRGFGRAAVQLIKKLVFERLGCHRLWLEVLEDNLMAYELYRSEGFVWEGVHRESLRRGDRFMSLIVMSLLEQEYELGESCCRGIECARTESSHRLTRIAGI